MSDIDNFDIAKNLFLDSVDNAEYANCLLFIVHPIFELITRALFDLAMRAVLNELCQQRFFTNPWSYFLLGTGGLFQSSLSMLLRHELA